MKKISVEHATVREAFQLLCEKFNKAVAAVEIKLTMQWPEGITHSECLKRKRYFNKTKDILVEKIDNLRKTHSQAHYLHCTALTRIFKKLILANTAFTDLKRAELKHQLLETEKDLNTFLSKT